jgi:hypothetical protein
MNFSKEEKAMWLEDWRQSGKTAWAYAKENGLVPQTFLGWAKPKNETSQALVEVPTQAFQSTRLAKEMLIEKGEIKIHIPLDPISWWNERNNKRIGTNTMTLDISKARIFIRPGCTDLRKAISGLSVMVKQQMAGEPFSGNVYFATRGGSC